MKSKKFFMNKSYYIFGKHAAKATIINPKRKILQILCTDNIYKLYSNDIKKHPYKIISQKDLSKILPQNALHQGIAIKTTPITKKFEIKKLNNKIAILDQIKDPHNVGAIIRSAALFNFKTIITTTNNSPEESSSIAKIASGGLEAVNLIQVPNISNIIDLLKKNNFWVLGLDCSNSSIKLSESKITSNDKICLILGQENKGLRQLTRKKCDFLVKISTHESKYIESLNVSNAAAIAFYAISNY